LFTDEIRRVRLRPQRLDLADRQSEGLCHQTVHPQLPSIRRRQPCRRRMYRQRFTPLKLSHDSLLLSEPLPGLRPTLTSLEGSTSLAPLCPRRGRGRSALHPATKTDCCRNAGITSRAKRLSCT